MRTTILASLLIAAAIGSSTTTAYGQQLTVNITSPTATAPAGGIAGATIVDVVGTVDYPPNSGYWIDVTAVIKDNTGKAGAATTTRYTINNPTVAGTINYTISCPVPAPTTTGLAGTVTVDAKSQRGYTGTGTSSPKIN